MNDETLPTPAETPPAPPPPRKRWLRKLLLWSGAIFLTLLLLVIFAGPPVLSSVGRGMIVGALNEQINGSTELQEFSFSWSGKVHLRGLTLRDRAGTEVFSSKEIAADVSLSDAMSGSYRINLRVDEPSITATQDADGTVNLVTLQKPAPTSAPPPEIRPEHPATPKPDNGDVLPDIRINLVLANGNIRFSDASGRKTEYSDVDAEAIIAGLDKPIRFQAALAGAGSVALQGELTMAKDGRLDLDHLHGPVSCTFDSFDLSSLQSATAAFSSVRQLEGILQGRIEYEILSLRSASGKTSLEVNRFRIAGPDFGPDPITLPTIRLSHEMKMDSSGTGTSDLSLHAGDFLTSSIQASTTNLSSPGGTLSATLRIDSKLHGLTETLRSLLRVKSGYSVEGTAAMTTELAATRTAEGLESATLTLHAEVRDLAATDEQKKPLPLDRELSMNGKASFRAPGLVQVADFRLQAGSLQVLARGGADIQKKTIQDSLLQASADLDDLSKKASSLFDLPLTFGGKIRIDSKVDASGQVASGTGKIQIDALRVDQPAGWSVGPLDLSVQHDATLDLQPGGSGTFSAQIQSREIAASLRTASAPIRLRDVLLTLSGSATRESFDLKSLDLSSSLTRGNASGKVTGIGSPDLAASGNARFQGDVAPLVEIAKAFLPDWKSATSSGTWEFTLPVESRAGVLETTPRLAIQKLHVEGIQAAGKPVRVKDADVLLESMASLRLDGPGSAQLKSATLRAPGTECTLSGTASGFRSETAAIAANLHLDATLQPDEVTSRCSAFLMGYAFSGETLSIVTDLSLDRDRYIAKGMLSAPRLLTALPSGDPKIPPTTISQRAAKVEFDLTADLTPSAEAVEIRTCRYQSETGRATLVGNIRGLEAPSADVTLSADTEIADLMRDLGLSPTTSQRSVKGKASASFALRGTAGKLNASGGATVTDLLVTMEGTKAGEPITLSDPKVEFKTNADVLTETMDVTIQTLNVSSTFLNGTLEGGVLHARTAPELRGLKGEFTYIPDKLGTVLGPLLPGKLTGSEQQKLSFTLDGRADEIDLMALLRASTGTAQAGIGQFTMTGLAARGKLDVTLQDQHVRATSLLDVNEGKTDLAGDLDLRKGPESLSTVQLRLDQVSANAEMAPLLTYIHPLFEVAKGALSGAIQGKVDCTLSLSHRGALPPELVAGNWEGTPKQPIQGKGHFQITHFGIQGNDLIRQLSSSLGDDNSDGIELNPVDFTIRDGRLFYDRPMKMKISGAPTQWTGSIGLDHTLDLTWEIPVTEKLIRKYGFLKFFENETLRIPLKGKTSSPRLQWDDVLSDLATKAAQKGLEDKVGDVIGGLLGGKDEKEAKKLLEDADRLYNEGKKRDAAPLYKKLHEQYRKTRAYKDNKDRIRERENES